MDEAQALADRVVVIAAGRIVAEGTPESIGGRAVGAQPRSASPGRGAAVATCPFPRSHDGEPG